MSVAARPDDPEEGVLVVRIPLKRRTRGGKRLMVITDTSAKASDAHSSERTEHRTLPEDPILKALGRAWRWKRLLDSGNYTSLRDLAAQEKIDKSYLSRLLRLTLLSPAITYRSSTGRCPRRCCWLTSSTLR
jgi:hypothetical protein